LRVYLDFNASTPVAPEVVARMQAVLNEPFGIRRAITGRENRGGTPLSRREQGLRHSSDATPARLSSQVVEAKPITTP